MHKRKHRKYAPNRDDYQNKSARTAPTTSHNSAYNATDNQDFPTPDPCLYIQAHEADVIRGPPAASARSLECQDLSAIITVGNSSGSGLIRWGPSAHSLAGDTDTIHIHKSSQPALWVDRYDVRLLLDHLPSFQSESTQVRPLSPSGWSDLPSDSEDTFFFSPDEVEDYRREKRRRLIDYNQEERLRALAIIDGNEEDPDPWGGSDEEPDETQRELIRRTASHIMSSPNPAQLEMRILANYGTDRRFAFLRGRWSRVWRTEKERAKQYQAEEAKTIQLSLTPTPLGGLAGYGDSDTDSDMSADKAPEEALGDVTDTLCLQGGHNVNEDAVKEARRARAREWSAQRRAEQSSQPEQI